MYDTPVQFLYCGGDNGFSATLDNAAVVDNGNGTVKIEATDHGFLGVGSVVYIEGTTNYDGMREITAVNTNDFSIKADYVAETLAGTETAKVAFDWNRPVEILEVRLHLSAAATQDTFTITIDSHMGAGWDFALESQDMNGVADHQAVASLSPQAINRKDVVRFAFDNGDGRTWGLETIIRDLTA